MPQNRKYLKHKQQLKTDLGLEEKQKRVERQKEKEQDRINEEVGKEFRERGQQRRKRGMTEEEKLYYTPPSRQWMDILLRIYFAILHCQILFDRVLLIRHNFLQ